MIKNIIAVLILLFMMIFQHQSYAKPAQPQVKGGFRSCTAYDYKYKSGMIDKKSEVKSYTQNYDEKGNVIEIISYEKNKISQRNKINNKYNDKSLLVETVYLDESGKAVLRYAYIYDAKLNKIADRTFNNAGKETANTIYKYDNNDFLIEAVYNIINDNKVENTSSIAFKNDNNGNKIEEYSNHSSDISISVTSEYKLDNSSSKSEMNTEESVKDSKSAPDKITYEYKYDNKGNILRQVRTSFDGFKLIQEFKYDEFGNVTEQIDLDENNLPLGKTVFVYSY